jgi:hypothetical protein
MLQKALVSFLKNVIYCRNFTNKVRVRRATLSRRRPALPDPKQDPDPESDKTSLTVGSGSGVGSGESQIRNKSFRIHKHWDFPAQPIGFTEQLATPLIYLTCCRDCMKLPCCGMLRNVADLSGGVPDAVVFSANATSEATCMKFYLQTRSPTFNPLDCRADLSFFFHRKQFDTDIDTDTLSATYKTSAGEV